jgi:hypothetical protein
MHWGVVQLVGRLPFPQEIWVRTPAPQFKYFRRSVDIFRGGKAGVQRPRPLDKFREGPPNLGVPQFFR